LIGYFQDFFWELYATQVREALLEVMGTPRGESTELDLAVHMRFKDYFQAPDLGVLSPEYFSRQVSELVSRGKIQKIGVFSDDDEIAHVYASYFSHLVEVEVFGPMRMSPSEAFCAIVQARHRIISNSSFAWWAAYLGNPYSTTVVPTPWFRKVEGIQQHPHSWLVEQALWID